MKVKELIELLQQYGDDTDVRIAQPTYDHWRTELAVKITGAEEEPVKFSAYHEEDAIIDEADEDNPQIVIVIR